MSKLVSEMTIQDWMDIAELRSLETLLTKSVHVLRLNLPSRGILVEQIKKEIERIEEG